MHLNLNFHHHTILVRCNEESVIQKLRDEFHFFVTEAQIKDYTEISLYSGTIPVLPSMVATKILEHSIIYHLGTRQYVDYFGEALTIWDKSERKIEIYSLELDRLYELGFLAIHSNLGQALDQDGYSRIHALAVSVNHFNAIVMLPSKGGKSTLLKNLLENPEVKIISDDMPLCQQNGTIHSFPSKLSLSEVPDSGILSHLKWHEFKREYYPPKWTASLSQLKERIELHPEKNKNLLISGHRLSNGESILSEVPKWKMIKPMMEHMIMGFGLPQIMELFLRFNLMDIFKLSYHALVRSIAAFNLVKNSKCFYFYMGPDKSYNAQLLLDTIYDQQIP